MGTGGGRHVMGQQLRKTAGWVIDNKIMVDPGPGALVELARRKIIPEILCISHRHLDHYGDSEAVIHIMSDNATKKRGKLFCDEHIILGEKNDETSVVNKYHQNLLEKIYLMKPGDEFENILATKTKEHADGIGFIFKNYKIGYTGDTGYSEEIARQYASLDVLVGDVIRARGKSDHFEAKEMMTLDAFEKIIEIAKPKRAVITHFGWTMLKYGPEGAAKEITESTGVSTVAARDGMEIDLTQETL